MEFPARFVNIHLQKPRGLMDVNGENTKADETGDNSCKNNTDHKQQPPPAQPERPVTGELREEIGHIGGAVTAIRQHRQEEEDEHAIEGACPLRTR